MDHAARVRLDVVLGALAAVAPVLAGLIAFRVRPFRRRPRLSDRTTLALGVLPPVAFGAALAVDAALVNATGSYVVDGLGVPSVWLLAVAGPWALAGFVAAARIRPVRDAPDPLTPRARAAVGLTSVLAAWSVYGPLTFFSAFGLGLEMSDADSAVVGAAIHRAFLGTALGCAVAAAICLALSRRGDRATAAAAAVGAMPGALLLSSVLSAALV